MALTDFLKATGTAAINTTGAWVGSVVPNAVTARAVWDNNVVGTTSSALGGSLTWGQIRVLPGTTTNAYSILTTAGATLTLTPSEVDAAGIGIDLSQATRDFTINSAIALGFDQTWILGGSSITGRLLTTGGAVSGAFNLAVTGPGRLLQNVASSFGGAGKTFTVSAGALVVPGVTSSLGNASNELVVGVGGCLDFNTNSLTPTQTNIRISGTGNYDYTTAPIRYYGALFFDQSLSGKIVTVQGENAVIGLFTPGLSFSFKLTGAVTDFIEINAGSAATSARLTNVANDFYAPGGLRVSSLNVTTKADQDSEYDIASTDALAGGANETTVFGDVRNTVRVMPSGCISSTVASNNTRTVNRTVSFDGSPTVTAIKVGNAGGATGVLAFAGDVTFSNIGGRVLYRAPGLQTLSFRKTISGSGPLQVASSNSPVQRLVLDFDSLEANAFTNWTGAIAIPHYATLQYGNGYQTLTNQLTTVAGTANAFAILVNKLAQDITLQHSSYSFVDDVQFSATNAGYTFSLGNGPVNGNSTTLFAAAAGVTVLFPGNISSQLVFGKSGSTGTCVVSGTNTRSAGTIGWTSGNLYLNSARALGNGVAAADAIVVTGTLGVLDNTSGSSVVLENGGVKQFDGDFSWGGSCDLDLGPGTTTYSAARTFTFTSGGGTKTLTIPSAATGPATRTWNVGGGTAGAKQRLFLNGGNTSLATTGSVTAGYYRINSASGLGNSGILGQWTVSSGAALELVSTTPSQNKEVIITGSGPQTDGVLRSVSGTSVWEGTINVPVQSPGSPTRIQVDAGTFTLSRSVHTGVIVTQTGTPLDFTAFGSTARLNQQRTLNNKVSDIRINNGGLGIVELSAANLHTGGTTCEGGTTRVTHVNATSTGTVQVNASATLESTVQSQFTTLRLGTNGSGARAVLKFAA